MTCDFRIGLHRVYIDYTEIISRDFTIIHRMCGSMVFMSIISFNWSLTFVIRWSHVISDQAVNCLLCASVYYFVNIYSVVGVPYIVIEM